jgi:hypothetical protein
MGRPTRRLSGTVGTIGAVRSVIVVVIVGRGIVITISGSIMIAPVDRILACCNVIGTVTFTAGQQEQDAAEE